MRIERLVYWSTYPFVALLLHGSTRTRVVLQHGSRVLLIRPRLGDGRWDLPGGGVHRRESPKAAAAREIQEETGIILQAGSLTQCCTRTIKAPIFSYRAVYFSARLDQKPVLKLQRLEVADARWFSHADIANLRLSQGVAEAVQDCLATK